MESGTTSDLSVMGEQLLKPFGRQKDGLFMIAQLVDAFLPQEHWPMTMNYVGEVREQHQNCRKEESSLVVDANDTCDDAQVLAEVKVQKCEKMKGVDAYPPEAPAVCDKDSSDVSYEVHARRIRNFYMQKVHEWVMAEEACTNATQKATARSKTCKVRNEGWKDKRQSCNAIQRMLDMEACDAWTEYYHCSQNNSCLLEATNAYVDANGTATAMQRSIVLQWRAMKRIECLLDALANNREADDLSNAITECRNKVHSTTSWALTYPYYKDWKPQMPSRVCEEPSFGRPGTGSYKRDEYETLPTKAPADACSADCCTRCWYFSCNSTTVLKRNAKQLTGFSQKAGCRMLRRADQSWLEVCYRPAKPGKDEPMEFELRYETRKVECWDFDSGVKLDSENCTVAECCNKAGRLCKPSFSDLESGLLEVAMSGKVPVKVCSAADCPVGTAVKAVCCGPTEWKMETWPKTPSCSNECGEPEQLLGVGQLVVIKVACAATPVCPEWIYSPWDNKTWDCSERDCGQGQLTQERPVNCTNPKTLEVVADDLCKGPKPETIRILCPATPLCVTTSTTSTSTSTTTSTTVTSTTTSTVTTTTSTSTTTLVTCDVVRCPKGSVPKPLVNRTAECDGGVCKAQDCCDLASWVYKSWDETKECGHSCGLKSILESRSVTCQVKATGQEVSRATCRYGDPEPASKRVLCEATADCDGCGSIWCGADSVPLADPPNCGSSCTRELCCKKFAAGFQATDVQENASAVQNSVQVANQGSSGGSVKFDGEAATPAEGGKAYYLGGKTGLPLGGTMSTEFTAVIYVKLLGSDNSEEETVMLKEGGPDDFGAWELTATPLKQLRVRSFKDSKSQAAIGCLCLSSYADEWAAVAVRYDGKGEKIELVVNGKVCCEATAVSDPSWSDVALRNSSAPVHLGLVPGHRRPGVVGEVSAVQIWDGALTDADIDHIVAQFSEASAWTEPQGLWCKHDILSNRTGVASLAACRALCTEDQRCKSVQYRSNGTCALRSQEACTRAEGCACDDSDSLASNHCPSGDVVAPVTGQPDKLAHYPTTCMGAAKKPWWTQSNATLQSNSAATSTTTFTTTSTTTTVSVHRASCDDLTCPAGYVAKTVGKAQLCKDARCEVDECCDTASWIAISWDETKECDPSCGLDEVTETRSVTCQVPATGRVVADGTCQKSSQPASERLLCPFTAVCESCGGIQCAADEVPVANPPSCGGSCTRQKCCKKPMTGVQAVDVLSNFTSVPNQGSSGKPMKFDGAAEVAEQGHAYRLKNSSGLSLGSPLSTEFTALAYLKLTGSDDAEEATVMLKEGGPDDHGAWELVATPLQQFRLRSFRDPKSQTFIGCLCLSSYADEWASVAVRYDGKGEKLDLVVNGKVCCQADKSTEPSWSDAALRQSTLVHLGMVPGSVRPGAAAEVHAVQLWESALTDPDLDHLVAHFSHVMAWSKAAELRCADDIISNERGVTSLAACRALCDARKSCKSVQFQQHTGICELRSTAACTRAEGCACDAYSGSFVSTHCPDGDLVAPVTKLPGLARYPATCMGAAKKPWWRKN
ncbi:unnamed protein product [Symbiodinium microadriaticum]|nr:unnamed protein product [Symbiodinium microadriaticum]